MQMLLLALVFVARPEIDRGLLPPQTPIEHALLQLSRSPQQEAALQKLLADQHAPGSPDYHHWLSAQEFGQRFGQSLTNVNEVAQWLAQQGLTVNSISAGRSFIDFSGSAAAVSRAFHTELHALEVNGVHHLANTSEARIPAALQPMVKGIGSLHDFHPHKLLQPRYTFPSSTGTDYAVVPGDLAKIYNLAPLFAASGGSLSGQGQTIVVIEDTNLFATSDFTIFRSIFGLSSFSGGSFSTVHPAPPSGANNCLDPGVNGDDDEATLDAEWASAAAPSASIVMASCANTSVTFGGLIALANLVDSASPPAIVSMSYGQCEAENDNAVYYAIYEQGAAEGISIFVSSGDEGAASCDAGAAHASHGIGISGLASTPFNVAVGGTDFSDTASLTNSTYWAGVNGSNFSSALSYIPEIPWDNSCASSLVSQIYLGGGGCNASGASAYLTTVAASGGPSGCAYGTPATQGVVSGTCSGYAKPAWQNVIGNPSDGVRDIPDVSLFAANGIWGHYYLYCFSDAANGGTACNNSPRTWSGGGGTSFAAPIMAGIQALVNQKWASRQGNPNPVYYAIARGEYGSGGSTACDSSKGSAAGATCTFHDVTAGDMDVNCLGPWSCYLPGGANGILSTDRGSAQPAFSAHAGWDFATGLGTVNAYNLVNDAHWGSPTASNKACRGRGCR